MDLQCNAQSALQSKSFSHLLRGISFQPFMNSLITFLLSHLVTVYHTSALPTVVKKWLWLHLQAFWVVLPINNIGKLICRYRVATIPRYHYYSNNKCRSIFFPFKLKDVHQTILSLK